MGILLFPRSVEAGVAYAVVCPLKVICNPVEGEKFVEHQNCKLFIRLKVLVKCILKYTAMDVVPATTGLDE